MRTCRRIRPARSASDSANASGALREPGHSTTSRTPPRMSSSTTTRACAVEGFTTPPYSSVLAGLPGLPGQELEQHGVHGIGLLDEAEVTGVGDLHITGGGNR